MKKKYSIFALILLLALFLCTPALAATEYGVIYDETDELGSDTLTMQGEETLPELSQTLGIDLRVDVLTQTSYDSIADTAAGIYARYGYGYGEEQEGATLTILMELQDSGTYAMPADGWYVYASLSENRGISQALADAIRTAVAPSMAERAWNGEDITMSAVALTQAVESMAQAAEDYILTNCPPDSSAPETSGMPETPEAPEPDSVGMEYVFDISNLLPYEEWEELEARAADISNRQHCGVYFALVDDFTDYGDGSVYEVTYQLYHGSELGMGTGRDGIIVLLSMEERDYAMFVYGEYAEYAFDEFGQEELEERFLGDFGDNDWYGGISNYLDACDEFLTKADAGDPVRLPYWEYFWEYFPAVAFLACLPAGAVCLVLKWGMKTVHRKTEADKYIAKGGLDLTEQYDRYTHTTETCTKIETESSSSSGSSSESGGGGSGRSGSF